MTGKIFWYEVAFVQDSGILMNILKHIRETIDKIFVKVKKPVPFFFGKENKNILLCDRDNFYRYNQNGNEASFTQIKIDHKFVNGMYGFKLIGRSDLDFYALYQSEYGAYEQKPLFEIEGYY